MASDHLSGDREASRSKRPSKRWWLLASSACLGALLMFCYFNFLYAFPGVSIPGLVIRTTYRADPVRVDAVTRELQATLGHGYRIAGRREFLIEEDGGTGAMHLLSESITGSWTCPDFSDELSKFATQIAWKCRWFGRDVQLVMVLDAPFNFGGSELLVLYEVVPRH